MLSQPKQQGGLGFRDFEAFNTALLAKQGWRLLINPEAFWGRILKGIYFPNSNFLVAKKGSHPSLVWSSLLHGRDLLLQGVRWQVRNGRSISFWTQKWVPFCDDFYIRSPLDPFHNRNTVFDFIEDGHWNGQYTVKSGYKHAIALMSTPESMGESSTNPSSKFWKNQSSIYFLNAPGLVRFGLALLYPSDLLNQNSSVAFGIVALDSTGLLRYVIGNRCHAVSPLHAEIIAAHSACSLAFNHGWFNAIVESDSQIAISLLSLDMSPPWSLAAVVEDIRIWAKNMHIRFSWVNRESNQVAHWVAHNAFSSTLGFSWDVSFPDELTSLSRSDLYGS
ncbi:reverse transcriptase [Tanacetum coccineum]